MYINLALSASWTHALIIHSVTVSGWNSVGKFSGRGFKSHPGQLQRILQCWIPYYFSVKNCGVKVSLFLSGVVVFARSSMQNSTFWYCFLLSKKLFSICFNISSFSFKQREHFLGSGLSTLTWFIIVHATFGLVFPTLKFQFLMDILYSFYTYWGWIIFYPLHIKFWMQFH